MSERARVVLEALEWRYATKSFDPNKKIDEQTFKALETSLRLSPSSYGLQPWRFIVVQNQELREKLKKVSWGQSQVTDCSHYVVLTARKFISEEEVSRFIKKTAEVRGVSNESLSKYRDLIVSDVVHGPRSKEVTHWAEKQVYIAMGFLMESAAIMGIDACPLEGLDPKAYDEHLGLHKSEFKTVAAVALGYRSSSDRYAAQKKVRYEPHEVVEYR